jgi:opacity protein-like surface antigen
MKKLIATMALAVLAFAPAFAADEAEGIEVVYVAGMTGVT